MRKEIEYLRKSIVELEKKIDFLAKSNTGADMPSRILEETIDVDSVKEKEDSI